MYLSHNLQHKIILKAMERLLKKPAIKRAPCQTLKLLARAHTNLR